MAKKIILVITLIFSILSCNTKPKEIISTQQENFYDFLSQTAIHEFKTGNDIQKRESAQIIDKKLSDYLDTVKLFINWKGQISSIKSYEESAGHITTLDFDISFKYDEYYSVKFICAFRFHTNELKDDYIFNKIKSISDFSTVYFDGFIKRKPDNSASYKSDFSSHYEKYHHPEYDFYLVKISDKAGADTLSTNLQNAINSDFKTLNDFKNAVPKIKKDDRIDKLHSLKFDYLKDKLTEEELKYRQRVLESLIDNFQENQYFW